MDPLSVLASVTGILAVAAKITTVVTELIQSVGDVPASTRSVLTEISDLNLCLSQLMPFLRGTRTVERTRRGGVLGGASRCYKYVFGHEYIRA